MMIRIKIMMRMRMGMMNDGNDHDHGCKCCCCWWWWWWSWWWWSWSWWWWTLTVTVTLTLITDYLSPTDYLSVPSARALARSSGQGYGTAEGDNVRLLEAMVFTVFTVFTVLTLARLLENCLWLAAWSGESGQLESGDFELGALIW